MPKAYVIKENKKDFERLDSGFSEYSAKPVNFPIMEEGKKPSSTQLAESKRIDYTLVRYRNDTGMIVANIYLTGHTLSYVKCLKKEIIYLHNENERAEETIEKYQLMTFWQKILFIFGVHPIG